MRNIIFFLFLFLSLNVVQAQTYLFGKVVRVADGDTFTILDPDKKQIRIRFYGIDCPEKGQDFYRKAKDFTSERSFGKNVKIEVKDKDRYGRIVGMVWIKGENLNLSLLQEGLAWHYTSFDKSKAFAQAEQNARKRNKNIWSHKEPIAPWKYRRKAKS